MSYGLSTGRPPHPTHNWKIHRDLPGNMPQSKEVYPLISPKSVMELKEQDNTFFKCMSSFSIFVSSNGMYFVTKIVPPYCEKKLF